MSYQDGLHRVVDALHSHSIEVREVKGAHRARCPIHEGTSDDSLSVRHLDPKGNDAGGRAQLRCFGGCDELEVLDLIGLSVADLYDEPIPTGARSSVREFPYLSGGGQLVGVVQRREPKTFRPLTMQDGQWRQKGNAELQSTPYRLPAVVAAIDKGEPVWIVEGERDADTLARQHIAATCNSGGAGKWTEHHARWLTGAHVTVCADADQPGRDHAAAVVATLQGVAASVRLVEPAEGHKDITEQLNAGKAITEVVEKAITDSSENTDTRPKAWTAATLMAARFPEPKWAVPNLIPMGCTCLAGPPKVGKSWLVLGLALAIAAGGKALAYQKVTAGPVLYLALEDSPIRLQNRLEDLLGDDEAPEDLHFWTEVERGTAGLIEIDQWLTEHPTARMVVVDVLQKFRGQSASDDRYKADYDALSGLKTVGDRHGVAMVVVHHTRKSSDSDFLQEVSGTNGIAGASDTIAVLRRGRTETEATLAVTGRDIMEAEHTLTMNGPHWAMITGPAVLTTMAPTRQAVFAALRNLAKPARPVDVAEKVSGSRDTVRKTMQRMADDKQILTDGRGRYWVPSELGHLWDTAANRVSAGQDASGTDGTPGTPPTPADPGTPIGTEAHTNLSQVSQNHPDQQKQADEGVSQDCPNSPSIEPALHRPRPCPNCSTPSTAITDGMCRSCHFATRTAS